MRNRAFNLAIETSGRAGSVTLGRGDEIVESAAMPPQQRHTVDLMPTIDRLCRAHGVAPSDLGEVYVSAGPGSFTGLRISIATVKLLAQVLEVRVVAVPTLDVLAQNVPAPAADIAAAVRLAVCLNVKHDTAHAGVYHWDGGSWVSDGPPGLLTLAQILAAAPQPLLLLGDPLPPTDQPLPPDVTSLPAELALARSAVVWRLGRSAAARGLFIDPLVLLPIYSRRPEAEDLWDKRHPAPPPEAISPPVAKTFSPAKAH